jgi:hypothetical protein
MVRNDILRRITCNSNKIVMEEMVGTTETVPRITIIIATRAAVAVEATTKSSSLRFWRHHE